MPEALARRGAVFGFHGVRMRPGKPVMFARLPGGQLVFGLPGNPVAALIGFRFFVWEAARAMLGMATREPSLPVHVEEDFSRDSATVFLKVRAGVGEDGARSVDILPGQQSHLMRPLISANAWLRVARDVEGRTVARLYPLMPNGSLL